jgi:hypothetical protein
MRIAENGWPPRSATRGSRSAHSIAVYDDLLARFGSATELPLREQVARPERTKRPPGTHKREMQRLATGI